MKENEKERQIPENRQRKTEKERAEEEADRHGWFGILMLDFKKTCDKNSHASKKLLNQLILF